MNELIDGVGLRRNTGKTNRRNLEEGGWMEKRMDTLFLQGIIAYIQLRMYIIRLNGRMEMVRRKEEERARFNYT